MLGCIRIEVQQTPRYLGSEKGEAAQIIIEYDLIFYKLIMLVSESWFYAPGILNGGKQGLGSLPPH
jgi:hypothetical protein